MGLFKMVYLAGIYFRNRTIFDCYKTLRETEKWDLDRLKGHQLQKLQDLVETAYRKSAFYRVKLDAAGVSPDSIRSLDDLKLLPQLSKEEVLANASSIQIRDVGEKLFFSETSGSTGRPLVFYRNQEWDAWHNASVMRGYAWHGVGPWERNGYLWGYNIAPEKRLKVRALDFLQNRFRLFSYKDAEVDRFLHKLKGATYLGGYSSMVYEVAKRVNRYKVNGNYRLKMVKGTSEKIFDSYRTEVEKAFGVPIVSEYGSAEGGIIAFGCQNGSMHLNMETCIAEIVDGEIVLTNLVSKSFPIIRYRLGDYVTIDNEFQCPCGMAHPVVKEVTGRVGDVVRGEKHTYPSLTLYYVFKNIALTRQLTINYQVVQNTPGKADCYVENELGPAETKLVLNEFDKYFGDDLKVTIKSGHVRDDYTKKRKDFISTIPNG